MPYQIKLEIPTELRYIDSQIAKDIIRQDLRRASNILHKAIIDRIKTDLRNTTKHGYNYFYTGKLARSFKKRVYVTQKRMYAKISSSADYAAIHEAGGTIRPKSKKFLTVPLPTGIPLNNYPSPRLNPRLFYRAGNVLFLRQGNIPLYVLKTQVRMPARKYASTAIRKRKRKIMNSFKGFARKVINYGRKGKHT